MTLYTHATAGGLIDQIGQPPKAAFDGSRWWDLRDRDPVALAATGWMVAQETPRPADAGTTTHDTGWIVDGDHAAQTWTPRPWTTDEQAARTKAANEATIRDKATTALGTNATFLGLTSPTNAQNAAQIKALTRQVNGLIRLTIRRLDGTE